MECSRRCKGFFKTKAKWRRSRRRSSAAAAAARGSVRLKVRKLQKLIPGGQGLNPDRLFSRTAHYILQLKLQVNVLQALSQIYQP
ncbi:hypothetical protein ACOSP7_018275 [Xanthoceras sorbifolium]